jgi:hypothetical protein
MQGMHGSGFGLSKILLHLGSTGKIKKVINRKERGRMAPRWGASYFHMFYKNFAPLGPKDRNMNCLFN